MAHGKAASKADKDKLLSDIKNTELLLSDRAKRQLAATFKAKKEADLQKKHVYKGGCTIEEVVEEVVDEKGEPW